MNGPILGTRERIGLLLGSFLIVLLSLLPIAAGYHLQTPEMRFNGAAFDWVDFAVHIVTVRAGMENTWQYTFFFTPLPQQGHYIKLFYLAIGNLASGTNASPLTVYYTSLAVFNFAACILVYRLIAEFFRQPKYRALAFLLAIFGSGLGWLMNLTRWFPQSGPFPIDLWLYDAYPFFSMMVFPHFSAVIVGQAGMILFFLKYRKMSRIGYPIGMVVIGLLLQTIQPFAPLIPFIMLGGILLGDWITTKSFPRKNFLVILFVGITQIPLVVYNYWVLSVDPIWQQYANQALTGSPSLLHILLGFFWFWAILLMGLLKLKLFRTPKRIGLLVWIILISMLAYVPWQMQRRVLFYYTLPLAILSTLVIKELISPWLSRRMPILAQRKTALTIPLVALVGFTNFYVVFVHIAYQLPNHHSGYYHPAAIAQAIDWLEDHSERDSVLLSTPETGFLAGVQAMQKVFVAHTDETANYQVRLSQVEEYYNNHINLADLEPANLEWVFYGPYEEQLGPNFSPPKNLEIAYQQGGVTIYTIQGEP